MHQRSMWIGGHPSSSGDPQKKMEDLVIYGISNSSVGRDPSFPTPLYETIEDFFEPKVILVGYFTLLSNCLQASGKLAESADMDIFADEHMVEMRKSNPSKVGGSRKRMRLRSPSPYPLREFNSSPWLHPLI